LETAKPLVTGLLVILPNFMAVQPALIAAYPAPVCGAAVDSPADTVPPRTGQEFSQTGHSGAGWYGLNA